MLSKLRWIAAGVTVLGMLAAAGPALSAPHEKTPKDKPSHEMGKGKPAHGKKEHVNGKDLVGDKIKKNGKHEFHQHGKFTASVDVSNGKIAGVKVKHSEKGDVAVTKYKTSKKMAAAPRNEIQLASLVLAQDTYVGTTWIGYGYIDDDGNEVIYWFPYDMILDGDTGAIEYYPADE
jgi:hypothetical protein